MTRHQGTPGRDTAAVLRLVGMFQSALQRDDRGSIVDAARQLVEVHAPLGDQWQQVAQLVAAKGELGLAREAIDLFVAASGGSAAACYQKAVMLAQAGLADEADALLRTLPEGVPSPEAGAFTRGMVAQILGKDGDARCYLERVAELRPQSGSTWLALAQSADLAREPELVDRIIVAERVMERSIPTERAAHCYAMGWAWDARGEHARAFAAFASGAELLKSTVAYDPAMDRRQAEDAVHEYSAERLAAIAHTQQEPTARTIFVTGLPRSGTTLVEQILTSHNAVDAGAEISKLELLAKEVGGSSYQALARYVGVFGPASAAQLWHHWLDERFAAPGRVVDKTVDASRYFGLAAALLPQAPLIWLTRSPLDRAWSCFRTYFMWAGMPWSYDLQDIAAHFNLEDQLLRQWQAILGDRLLVVPLEALIDEPDSWIRRILAHCGLAEEPQVFAPHENRRAVTTASAKQVRQPINRAGIGSAEPYREFLAPFIAAYSG